VLVVQLSDPSHWNELPLEKCLLLRNNAYSYILYKFSIPPPSLDCSFPLGLGQKRL